MLHVACWMVHVACCAVLADRLKPHDLQRILHVACRMLHVACCMLHVARHRCDMCRARGTIQAQAYVRALMHARVHAPLTLTRVHMQARHGRSTQQERDAHQLSRTLGLFKDGDKALASLRTVIRLWLFQTMIRLWPL